MQWLKRSYPVMLSLLIGCIGGFLFFKIQTPLPLILGPIVAIAVASRIPSLPLKSPKMFSSPSRAILGITIGSAFTPEMVKFIGSYISSLILVIPFVFLVTYFGMMYYWKFLKFDKTSAYFSAMPGGLLEMVMLAESLGANVYKVTLAQSTRLFLIVFTLPFLIEHIAGVSLGGRSGLSHPWVSADKIEFVFLAICAVAGWKGALKLKIPGGTIIGPMILGAVVYSLGLAHSRPPDEIIMFVQLILGTTVGFVFVGISLREIAKVMINTLGYFVILMVICVFFVWIVTLLTEFPFVSILLAFAPGGQAEMNLIAIIVGANLPYVALHHIVRIFLVMGVAPIFVSKLRKK